MNAFSKKEIGFKKKEIKQTCLSSPSIHKFILFTAKQASKAKLAELKYFKKKNSKWDSKNKDVCLSVTIKKNAHY